MLIFRDVSPLTGVVAIPNGLFMAYECRVTNYLQTGMILQVRRMKGKGNVEQSYFPLNPGCLIGILTVFHGSW